MPTDDITIEQQANQAGDAMLVAPFFAVSLLKLTVLSVCTFGIYELYWFYRNWQLIKERESIDISPFWRAFFPYFYCYQCFSRICNTGAENSVPPNFPAGALAAGWIVASLTYKLPDPYWLVTFFAIVFILPVQVYVNRVNAVVAPQHNLNSRFTPWNWAGIIVGGLLVMPLVVIETFMPNGTPLNFDIGR